MSVGQFNRLNLHRSGTTFAEEVNILQKDNSSGAAASVSKLKSYEHFLLFSKKLLGAVVGLSCINKR